MNSKSIMVMALLAGTVSLTGLTGSTATGSEMNTLSIYSVAAGEYTEVDPVQKSPREWRETLNSNQYRILREEGTEPPFNNAFWDNKREGIYRCAGCGTDLFSSTAKYKSGTGWPSFWEPVAPENVKEVEDNSFFMRRVEVECARCGGHLGHIFNDGPAPTGLRYCINSASLTFTERSSAASDMKREN